MNRAARELLANGDGLALCRSPIEAGDGAAAKALGAMVHAAARGLLNGVGGVVSAPRPSGKADYVVSVARCVADLSRALGAMAAVVVTIADPARGVAVEAATLRRMWDLTAAEALLALALADGASLEEVALRSAISIETARVHLKRALAKSGTHRQSELVRLILTGPGSVL